jgi:hypothetical protein
VKFQQLLMVSAFSVGMGIRQLLLKYSDQRQSSLPERNLIGYILSLFADWAFLLEAAIYGILLLYWVWLLTFLPLSKAYPFTLLSLIVAAIGGAVSGSADRALRGWPVDDWIWPVGAWGRINGSM